MNCFTKICITTVMPLFLYSQEQESNEVDIPSDSKQISFSELTVEHGLSQNSVVSIAQDSIGYMWFATQDGLNKYDGRSFTFYNKHFEDVTRPTYSKLGKIYVDKTGALWIISNSGILERFDQKNNRFNSIQEIPNASCLLQHSNQDYYIGTYNKGLYHINNKTNDTLQIFKNTFEGIPIFDINEIDSSVYVTTSNHLFKINNSSITKEKVEGDPKNFSVIVSSSDKTIWLGTFGKGLYHKTKAQNEFVQYKLEDLPNSLNIQDLLVDKNDHLWIATYGDGAYRLDIKTGIVKHFVANKNDPYALHYDDVLCLYEDYTGTIWLGTDGAGLSYYDEHHKKFNTITNDQTPKDVHVDVVRAITVDDANTIWLGTSGKGLTSVNRANNSFKTFTVQNSGILSDRIMSLLYHNGELWVGHQGKGLQILNSDGDFKNYGENTTPALPATTIWKIFEDSENRIWLGTRNNGVIQFDENNGVLNHFKGQDKGGQLVSSNIRTITEGEKGILYIGADDGGIDRIILASNKIEPIPELNFKVKSLYFESPKTLWVGTNGDGLISFDTETKEVLTFNTKNGLLNNVIYGILPDENGNLWLSSNRGLSQLNPKNSEIVNYSNYDGLQASEFNTGAYFKSSDRTLYFGGLEGLNWFKSSQLSANTSKPRTVISKFEVFSEERPFRNSQELAYNDNTVTFTFAGLHYAQPQRNQYKYKLVNHDEDWIDAGNTNSAHYTNLSPNDYEFLVKSSNYDGIWNEDPTSFKFTINKPWYLSNWAIIIYSLIVITAVYLSIDYYKWKWKLKLQLKMEHQEAERLKSLNDFKSKLYTNISHEIRTPLTLIKGPIENQLQRPQLTPKDQQELNLVKKNSERLLNLVNQMSDLALVDSGQMRVKVSKGNLNNLLEQLIKSFSYRAKEKRIVILWKVNDLCEAWYDQDIIEKIISNLLNNAIKYAPTDTKIHINAMKRSADLVFNIINKNPEITKTDLSKLFGRFYKSNQKSEGIGVGLALVKELVALYKGQIIATSLNEEEIQFTVTIPITVESFSPEEIVQNIPVYQENDVLDSAAEIKGDHKILIVEDNLEIRDLLHSLFKNHYQIQEAINGIEAWEITQKTLPDIVISDIMMPIMDGMELCRRIKSSVLTSHIPVILLTAKVGEENELQGYETGADVYITKPFDPNMLTARVKNILDNRIKWKEHYAESLQINPDVVITNTEKKFLRKLKQVLDEHLTEPDLSADSLSELLGVSRTQLHRKLKSVVGMSTTEFIRHHRLKMGKQLLQQTDANISEIAFKIGFNSPSYFTRCFKSTYDTSPEDFRKSLEIS